MFFGNILERYQNLGRALPPTSRFPCQILCLKKLYTGNMGTFNQNSFMQLFNWDRRIVHREMSGPLNSRSLPLGWPRPERLFFHQLMPWTWYQWQSFLLCAMPWDLGKSFIYKTACGLVFQLNSSKSNTTSLKEKHKSKLEFERLRHYHFWILNQDENPLVKDFQRLFLLSQIENITERSAESESVS